MCEVVCGGRFSKHSSLKCLYHVLTTALYYDCFILMDKVRTLISSTSCLLCNNIVLFFKSSSSTLWETVSFLTFLPLTVCYSVHTYPLTVCYSVHTYPLTVCYSVHTCKQISSDYQSLMVYGYRGSNLTCAIYKKLPNSPRNDQHSLKTSQNIYTFVSPHEKTPGHDSQIFSKLQSFYMGVKSHVSSVLRTS